MKSDLRCLPYWRAVRFRYIPVTGPFIGKSLRFFGGMVGPLGKRKARLLRGPGIAQYRKGLFVGHGFGISAVHAPNLICGGTKMSIRINLDLEPEYEAFVKEWADKLGIRPSELVRRVVQETCNGYRYEERIPDHYPLERRPDWKRLNRRRDRRKKRVAARLN
jgi:hypothetical protein